MEPAPLTIPSFFLVIERGQSRFPRRPINMDRFLIGAGSNCQLQLGGQIPFLHSIIVKDEDHLWIDAVVAEPPLLINGQRIRESELQRGDIIEIGEFVFSIDRQEVIEPAAEIELELPTPEQLIQTLTEQLDALHRIATGKATGAKSLLQAIAAEKASVSPTKRPEAVARPASATAEAAPADAASTREYSLTQLQLLAQQKADSEENAQRKIA